MICEIIASFFREINITDLAIASASIVGAYVALSGLSTWRHQLKGKTEYDLAKRILLGLFKYRDAIQGVRNPVMWAHEKPSPPEEERRNMNLLEINHYGTEKAYQKRWDRVSESRLNLYPDLTEGEVLWGTELNERFKRIFKLQAELMNAVRNHLELTDPNILRDEKGAIAEDRKKIRELLYDKSFEESDEFSKNIESAIRNIEDYLKPKLEL